MNTALLAPGADVASRGEPEVDAAIKAELGALHTLEAKSARWRFVQLVTQACERLGVRLEWLSDYWIARLEKGGAMRYLQGCTFPLNGASVDAIMCDKVATYAVLQRGGVPAVPHYLLRKYSHDDMPAGLADEILATHPLPLVIKPNTDTSRGAGVTRCLSAEEFRSSVAELSAHYSALAVSPYISVQHEYRTVVLDGQVKLVYEKVRAPLAADGTGEWRHNISLGATPEIQTDPVICDEVGTLAVAAMEVVGGRFATVDIVKSSHGYQVLEINGSVAFSGFIAHRHNHASIALDIYAAAIQKSFES